MCTEGTMPEISVIIPVYKVEDFLCRCVDSVLAQTYTDFELILVDDGSPDRCGEMCDEYAEKDHRIHVIHRENGGLSAARNSGIEWSLKNSDSKWLTFIDSDDWISPVYLESMMCAIKEYDVDVVIGTFARTKEYEKPVSTQYSIKKYEVEDYWMKDQTNATVAWAKLYKKSDFEDLRYPHGKIHEDQYTTYKVLFKYESVAVVETPILFYYYNAEGITKSNWKVARLDIFGAHKNQIEFFKKNRYERAYKNAVWCYLDALCENIRAIKNNKQFSSYKNLLRKELRSGINTYKQEFGLSYKSSFRFYKYAYPLKTKIYRKLRIV